MDAHTFLTFLAVAVIGVVVIYLGVSFVMKSSRLWWRFVRAYNHSYGKFTIFFSTGEKEEVDTTQPLPNEREARLSSKDIMTILLNQGFDFAAIFRTPTDTVTINVLPKEGTKRADVHWYYWRQEHSSQAWNAPFKMVEKELESLFLESHGIIIVNQLNKEHGQKPQTNQGTDR